MKPSMRFPWMAAGGLLIFTWLVGLACQLPFAAGPQEPTAPPDLPTSAPKTSPAPMGTACQVPNLVGMELVPAETTLNALGLSMAVVPEVSPGIPEGLIFWQDPAAATRLEPCRGKVTLTFSQAGPAASPAPPQAATAAASKTPGRTATGPASATTTKTPAQAATRKPSPTIQPTPAIGSTLKNPASYDILYLTMFPPRSHGFSDIDWVVVPKTGSQVKSDLGRLSVRGRVEAYAGEIDWGSYLRVYLGGGTYGIGLKEFSVLVDVSEDLASFLRLGCADASTSDGKVLRCQWYQSVDGVETLLPNTSVDLCNGTCDIEIEIDGPNYRTYANRVLRSTLQNETFYTGMIGLRIEDPAEQAFNLDRVVVYSPAMGAGLGFTLLHEEFSGDWDEGKYDSEYAASRWAVLEGEYQVEVDAKKNVSIWRAAENAPTLPNKFRLQVDARRVIGDFNLMYGVIFRYQDGKNFYFFGVTEENLVLVYALQNDAWVELLRSEVRDVVEPLGINSLVVEANGSRYGFMVNDEIVGEVTDTRFVGGTFGVITEVQAGQSATVGYGLVEVDRLP